MKSKLITGFSWTTAAIILLVSCTDLDVDIKSQYTNFPDTERAAEAISADVYAAYRGALGRDHWMVQTLSSDEAVSVALGTDYYDGGRYREFHVHNWTPDNGILPTLWNSAMTGINLSNNVLAIFNDDDGEKAAPMRAMRAYFYFLLMDNFGDVPLITGKVDRLPDRSPRAEIAHFIESELLAVRDKLPDEASVANYGKATRYMADALLAKLYLNWAVYTAPDIATYTPSMPNEKLNDVVAMCDDIIQSGQFNLTSHKFLEKFRPDNGPQIKDFVFAMPFDREKQQGMTYARFWIHRSAQNQFAPLPQSVGGTFRVLPAFLDKFNLEGDDRNASYIGGLQYYWSDYAPDLSRPFLIRTSKKGIDQDYAGPDADVTFDWHMETSKEIKLRPDGAATLNAGNDQKGRSMGYRSIKFYMDVNVTAANQRNQSNDVPIFRYADVLLMKAEAILRGATPTNGDSPQSLINQVRAYVNAPALTTAPTLEELLDERAREFADESWRRNDLIRFGKFEDDWGFKSLYSAGYTERFRRIFPIPTTVLNVNTNWTQNKGY
ncbi:putative outer membrane starch-binding protein [Sphingobacterium allocomposti]|uniref:Putative outer membrane starch-binding protein n=1 Tax=Sphingobacterium allocomposti TaxID=415956 RepID=A0A5S5DC59_9SPHI|nr:RagB/SusD family nutrient uptake outer membrane protein [Sphingobacterium composti Yoo et al. 2007 non Ten et al. 2007]TYP92292.1 putative outer membrane starch-binding protein [Sphingobacterium composti Yoo et al. 2007 non Ten et al. 2007]HLS94721.1 RagB/SusD family nutrient uptake outer membrane protein [Sphingobacterium sp.]